MPQSPSLSRTLRGLTRWCSPRPWDRGPAGSGDLVPEPICPGVCGRGEEGREAERGGDSWPPFSVKMDGAALYKLMKRLNFC